MSLSRKNTDRETVQATEQPARSKRKKEWLTVREMTVFAMLGTLLFCSKLLMEWAPNIHFVALFIIVYTRVYRAKALIPIYLFVLLTGVYGGFSVWWIPYLYIWLPAWGLAMLIPRRLPRWLFILFAVLIGGVHGMAYGTLYAPAQALFFKMDAPTTLAWIAVGLPWDALHAAGNMAACTLAYPLSVLLQKLENGSRKQ